MANIIFESAPLDMKNLGKYVGHYVHFHGPTGRVDFLVRDVLPSANVGVVVVLEGFVDGVGFRCRIDVPEGVTVTVTDTAKSPD
jgi:hypothetical protein